MLTGAWSIIPLLLAITAFALIWGGVSEYRRKGGNRTRAMLMIIAGAVFLGNVAILTV